jgi:hypothetical protein
VNVSRKIARVSIIVAAAMMLHGCAPYPYYPPSGAYSSPAGPASFENSWQAARGAASDDGVYITVEDRSSGLMRGTKGAFEVVISVKQQMDGSVVVGFTANGPIDQDPRLLDRLKNAYERRMGR